MYEVMVFVQKKSQISGQNSEYNLDFFPADITKLFTNINEFSPVGRKTKLKGYFNFQSR